MKTGRLVTITVALGILLFVFLITSNSTILGKENASESTTEDLVSKIERLQEELKTLKERVNSLESEQWRSPTLPEIVNPSQPLSNFFELPKGSDRREVHGIPYTVIPLQDQIIKV